MQYLKHMVLLSFLLLAFGCTGTDGYSEEKPTVKVRLLWEEIQCATDRLNPQLIWIDNPIQFQKTYARLTQLSTGDHPDFVHQVNFSGEGVVIVAMGRKPTAGYGLKLNREYAVIKNDAAELSVSWIEPPKDAILAQIITSPCIGILLPKGPYSQIQLLDQDGHLRLQVRFD